MTRNVYVSSSFVPRTMSRTTVTAVATKETPSAAHQVSIVRSPFVSLSAASSIAASTTSSTTNPSSAIRGSRSATTIGGMKALRTAIAAAARRAAPKPFTEASGTIEAATRSETDATTHARTIRRGRRRGRSTPHSGA